MRKIIKLVLLTVILGFASLFLAALISFLISQVIPGDPVLAYLPDSWTQPQYDIMYQILGLNQPIIIQFFRYISNMLTGNWGLSLSISRGFPVYDLIMNRIPLTFCRIIIPLIVGLVLGFVFGNYSMKFKSKKGFRTVQILSITGFVIPFILLNILSQFFILNLNLMVLWILLTISVTALTILLSRIYLDNLSKEASRKRSNTIFILLVGASFGIIFLFLIQTELLSFGGIGELLLQAISSADYYVINVIIFLILFSFPIFIIFSLFSFFLFGKIKSHYNLKK